MRIRVIHAYQSMFKLLSVGHQSPSRQVQQRVPRRKKTSLNHTHPRHPPSFRLSLVLQSRARGLCVVKTQGNQVTTRGDSDLCRERAEADIRLTSLFLVLNGKVSTYYIFVSVFLAHLLPLVTVVAKNSWL